MWALLYIPLALALGAEGAAPSGALRGARPLVRARESEPVLPAQAAQPEPWQGIPGWFTQLDPDPEPVPALRTAAAAKPPKELTTGRRSAWSVACHALSATPWWLLTMVAAALASIIFFIFLLLRFIQDGYQVHWMAGLPAQTDFQRLGEGDFIKVVGHVVPLPGAQALAAPLSRTPCVAYGVSVHGRGPRAKTYTRISQVKSFCVQDEQGRLLLVHGHEAILYDLTSKREWSHAAVSAPKEFQPFVPKEHRAEESRAASATPLRYHETVLEVGAKVCCVGTASTRPTAHAPVSLRPAYATITFRDAQIPWAKLSGLSTADWGKVAASVLVTSYRLGR